MFIILFEVFVYEEYNKNEKNYFVLERNLLLNRIHTIELLVGENNDHGITH